MQKHNQYAADTCPHLTVTCQLEEKRDSIGHKFNTTDPLKFNSIGEQKVNSVKQCRIIWHAGTSALEAFTKQNKYVNKNNYATSLSPRHILKFHTLSSLVIKVNKFIIPPFPRAVSKCCVIQFNSIRYKHASKWTITTSSPFPVPT
jgi:hypothetical protein